MFMESTPAARVSASTGSADLLLKSMCSELQVLGKTAPDGSALQFQCLADKLREKVASDDAKKKVKLGVKNRRGWKLMTPTRRKVDI